MNINTRAYWDSRFGSGDWEEKGGFSQTRIFAEAQVPLFDLPATFDGSVCDFGCGAGDAFPVYHQAWPRAKLVGVDFSKAAIDLASARFGAFASFVCGEVKEVPRSDVIIASNVLEHLEDDEGIVAELLRRCGVLHVVVPWREPFVPGAEHVRSYDRTSFARFRPASIRIFPARTWSQYGKRLWWDVYAKNLARPFFGRRLVHRAMQVLFTFRSA